MLQRISGDKVLEQELNVFLAGPQTGTDKEGTDGKRTEQDQRWCSVLSLGRSKQSFGRRGKDS